MLMVQVSSILSAQNSRTDINSVLSSWIWPIVGLGFLLSFAGLIWHNWDALRGKNGLSAQDGWMAVGLGLVYVLVGLTALQWVATKVASMNYSI